jgi:single-strand DNA-binding protein
MNSTTITGRLGRDPKIRQTRSGKTVCDLSVAVNERVPRGAGYTDSVTWHTVVLWQGLAEDARSLRKGTAIRVEGTQRTRQYTGRDGETRTVVEIVASKFEVLDSLPKSPSSAPAKTQSNGVPRASIPAGSEWDAV